MIPRIIHYTWFSGEPFPPKVQECIDSWHRYMPDYEFILWDAERIREINSEWLQECLAEKKWAFAADYVRMYAVAHYGGVYLDTDCLVFQSFDSLLSHTAFIGREWTIHHNWHRTHQYLTSHCFGAEKGNPFIISCLHYYDNRHFVTSQDITLPQELRYDMTLLPFIQYKLAETFGYDSRPSLDNQVLNFESITILPSSYFDPYKQSASTYCTHLCLGSWRSASRSTEKTTLSYRIKYHLNKYLFEMMDKLGYMIVKKD